MASTSASRSGGAAGRIKSAATTLFSDNQSLLAEIRKVVTMMKDATDFKKLFDDEIAKSKANSSSVPQNHMLLRQFREAIWDLMVVDDGKVSLIISESNKRVHHAGQPMPGEEQEDLVMTSTQSNILNINCPLTGKPITELENPVRRPDVVEDFTETDDEDSD
ncbi:hypothetical protein RHGRI_018376 [Rhododendron griersonianum]|uniref:Uncharacterized protein n=1 Tax=Rhododendron griersonianum TaxID=479676 RepID=A0AAV6K191_9ERIC|nr:hypothetical protein RHGRI_018376 [Rhododendron griersonianum]